MTDIPAKPTSHESPDPWEDTQTAHLRAFLKLTYTERFRLLMQAIEFMNMLRPKTPVSADESRSITPEP